MPQPSQIEVLNKLEGDLASGNITSVTAADLDHLAEGINKMVSHENETERASFRKRLTALREGLAKSEITQKSTKEIQEKMQALTRRIDANYFTRTREVDGKTETDIAGSIGAGLRVLPAGAYAGAEAVGKAINANPETVMAVGGLALAGSVVAYLWARAQSAGERVTAGIVTAAAAVGSYFFLPPSWQEWIKSFSPFYVSPEAIKKLEDQRQKQEKTTDEAVKLARESIATTSATRVDSALAALVQIRAETALINRLPADRRDAATMKARVDLLTKAQEEFLKNPDVAKAEKDKKEKDEAEKKGTEKAEKERLVAVEKRVREIVNALPEGLVTVDPRREVGRIDNIRVFAGSSGFSFQRDGGVERPLLFSISHTTLPTYIDLDTSTIRRRGSSLEMSAPLLMRPFVDPSIDITRLDYPLLARAVRHFQTSDTELVQRTPVAGGAGGEILLRVRLG